MNRMPTLHYINSMDHIKRIQRHANTRLIKHGVITGNTLECTFDSHYVTTAEALTNVLPALRRSIPKDVWEIEKREYEHMKKALVNACRKEFRRDIHGRRGLSLHPGCISYQHCVVRRGTLVYTVHMRGMDTRKFIADIFYMLNAAQAVARDATDYGVDYIHLHLLVDCLHRYTQEVPL